MARDIPTVVTDAFTPDEAVADANGDELEHGADDPTGPSAAEKAEEDEALHRLERVDYVPDSQVTEPDIAFSKLEMMATLLSGGFTAGQSNVKYALGFEVDLEGFNKLTSEFGRGKGGYDVTWNQIAVGQGVEVVAGSFNRDADGQPRFKFKVLLPSSELSRSIGRLGAKAKGRAKLVLEPMQGTFGLPDGTEVDLTARAE